jgi:hypothetical protein
MPVAFSASLMYAATPVGWYIAYKRDVIVVMAVTCLEDEKVMEEWWERNRASLEASEIVVEGHACVMTLKNEAKYEASRGAVGELIRRYATVIPMSGGWKKEGIVNAFMRWFSLRQPDPEDNPERLQGSVWHEVRVGFDSRKHIHIRVAQTC